MDVKTMKSKKVAELEKELVKQTEKLAKLKQDKATKQVKPHEFGVIKKTIARLKTVINEQRFADNDKTGEKDA